MAVDQDALFVPGHGTLFMADPGTALPDDPISAFGLTAGGPSGWDNIGHTSKDNTPAFKKDGGDATFLDSWISDSVGVVYASTDWSLGFNPIQVDKDALDLAFGGNFDTDNGYIIPAYNNGVEKALLLYMTDGTGVLLFYIPNTKNTLGDSPTIDPAKFFEMPLTASILSADTDDIPAANNGIPAIMKLFKSGLVLTVPTITSALPASMGAGDFVRLAGTGFSNASAVTIGGSAVENFEIYSDTEMDIQLPTGSAGAEPIVVTNIAGNSTGFSYTRTT